MNRTFVKNATTGLAGAVAIASASQAYGAVVSTTPPANFVPTTGATNPIHSTLWDVNGDGTTDFGLGFYQKSASGNWVSGIYGIGGTAAGNAAVGTYEAYGFYAAKLSLGNVVGPTSGFGQTTGYYAILASRFSGTFYGNFVSTTGVAQTGFIGFEFTAADGIHYGAVQVTTSPFKNASNKGGQIFSNAEYETVAGVPLVIAAVPEPTSLAALAFGMAGAAGVALRRRQKAASASLPA